MLLNKINVVKNENNANIHPIIRIILKNTLKRKFPFNKLINVKITINVVTIAITKEIHDLASSSL